jgi:hypothetical protein
VSGTRASRANENPKSFRDRCLATSLMKLILASEWDGDSEEWLIPNLVCDSLTLISGEPKSGKSSLACHIVRSLVLKQEILGFKPKDQEFKVAYMGFDFKWQRETRDRLLDLVDQVYFPTSATYKSVDEWDSLGDQMIALGINFLVIDHLYNYSNEADLDRANQVQMVFNPIMKLIERTGAAVLLLTQGARGQGGRAGHSVAIEGQARWLLRLSSGTKKKTLTTIGNNAETRTFTIQLTPESLELAEAKSGSQELKPADGGLPDRARYIMDESPYEARESSTKLGKWLATKNIGLNSDKSARTAVNNLIKAELLARDGTKGRIIKGPKLVG